ncbi:MAG TPA: glycoside hydrolase family 95 protein, partial [Steroidobacteraceae bacterium]|nr:glycoside hydrolase family 95 protein [Steroidobacteraceae bacterium]
MSKISRRTALKTGAAFGAAAAGVLPGRLLAAGTTAPANPLTLWYKQPAEQWTEALPIGNGRLGAMIFGGVATERLQLNEDTLYGGGPYDPSSPEALAALPRVRELINAGDYAAAQNLADEKLMGRPQRMPSFQTVGDLLLSFAPSSFAEEYRRDLDLESAIASVEYRQNGVTFRREYFASAVDQVIVIRLTADRPGALHFRAAFGTPMPGDVILDGSDLVLRGANTSQNGLPAALRYEARARITTNGAVSADDGALVVRDADSALIVLAMATNYRRFDDVSGDPTALTRAVIGAAAAKHQAQLLGAHVAAHQRLFGRVSLYLGDTAGTLAPTDQRIRESQRSDDPALAALYFQYARYLLICCSRPGTQPANLQGLWNDKLAAPWGSKYTININTEMNYWPAENTNLSECHQPLFDFMKELAVNGAITAKTNYNINQGWVTHHNSDLWAKTSPPGGMGWNDPKSMPRWSAWPMAGAWF